MSARIVVGVDGSAGSRHALSWALAEAHDWDAGLDVVYVWGQEPYYWSEVPGVAIPHDEDDEKNALELVDHMLSDVKAECDGIAVTKLVVEGRPSRVLVEQSENAELVVVGSRGRGGFADLVLGSVSNQVAHHAKCPVVIVPPAKQGRDDKM